MSTGRIDYNPVKVIPGYSISCSCFNGKDKATVKFNIVSKIKGNSFISRTTDYIRTE